MSGIRVLVVDDAVVVRRMVADAIDAEPDLECVGTAPNGRIALSKLERLEPDVVVLDVDMPELDGLDTLRELRRRDCRTVAIMFSALTERGAAATLEALALGADDYVTKPTRTRDLAEATEHVRAEMLPRIRALAEGGRTRVRRTARSTPAAPHAPAEPTPVTTAVTPTPVPLPLPAPPDPLPRCRRVDVVAIGTSTGGPDALERVLCGLPAGFPAPVLVVQHMPAMFTAQLADRLDARSALRVVEADDGMALEAGAAYIAPGGRHMVVVDGPDGPRIRTTDDPPEHSCRPAVDVLFRSLADTYRDRVLAVVLTGMGSDGLLGARRLIDTGSEVFAQDQATSVVWGMPGQVVQHGLAVEVLALEAIAAAVDARTRSTR